MLTLQLGSLAGCTLFLFGGFPLRVRLRLATSLAVTADALLNSGISGVVFWPVFGCRLLVDLAPFRNNGGRVDARTFVGYRQSFSCLANRGAMAAKFLRKGHVSEVAEPPALHRRLDALFLLFGLFLRVGLSRATNNLASL
ncbi:MAG: hypothetical protein AAF561_00050 [Planctomycetota bacterium]